MGEIQVESQGPAQRRYRHWRALYILVAVISALALYCVGPLWLYNRFVCREQASSWYRNPAGGAGYVARVQSSDCGALSGYHTEVIVRSDSFLRLPGTYDSQIIFEGNFHPQDLQLTWESSTHLVIEYPLGEDRRIREALPTWQGITITRRPHRP